ncbi:DUF485 domain-containing protein [Rhodobacter capsulatus]|uniref:Uncharacterized membrane protein, DUF485 family n=1 Tax=Rhodobacter capsulatus TaxID=1061 RepID=A0A0Q0VFV7_RHOCA|nr:DUF485 domain-containing protein [Rhodobacter capsulatus]KQB13006.1 hypothetical protein AP071_06335 [Rhodobacter capsulatus]KQB15862.1 hypothetical protein AP073_12790 [Rhodobacter capsulatus]PZX28380.1 uncharacterized membrane protein (DUF485 family) [Rhodobacter capsulatus]QNR62667.1 DUF485 domain-containing protein [Rhodobacter capsulatus]WER08726.1 DUF485 domain-containing protein [Rhodobacter capsulatus]
MQDTILERIARSPAYNTLKRKRLRFGWLLTIAMLLVYYGFITVIAFRKDLLAVPIGEGVMTWGIPIGFGVILFTVVVTAIYVLRANSDYDELTAQVKREVLK